MRVEITEICESDAFHSGLLFSDAGERLIKSIPVVGTFGEFTDNENANREGFLAGWFVPEETSPLSTHTKQIFFVAVKVKKAE